MWFLVKFLLFSALAFVMLVAVLSVSSSDALGLLVLIGLAAGVAQFRASQTAKSTQGNQ